jgi:hypothetical protein
MLLQDFLEALEGIAGQPATVDVVGRTVAGLMAATLQAEHDSAPPS